MPGKWQWHVETFFFFFYLTSEVHDNAFGVKICYSAASWGFFFSFFPLNVRLEKIESFGLLGMIRNEKRNANP